MFEGTASKFAAAAYDALVDKRDKHSLRVNGGSVSYAKDY